MTNRMVTVDTFSIPGEARIARQQLTAAGIDSALDGENVGTNLFHLGPGLGGIKLLVREEDAEQARRVLGDKFAERPPQDSWTCPRCGTLIDDGRFEACWTCGAFRDDPDLPPVNPAAVGELGECPMCGEQTPVLLATCQKCGEKRPGAGLHDAGESSPDPGLEPDSPRMLRQAEANNTAPPTVPDTYAAECLRSAWRAACLGCFLPPLLQIYSIWKLFDYQKFKATDGSDDDWRAPATIVIDILGIVAGLFFLQWIAGPGALFGV